MIFFRSGVGWLELNMINYLGRLMQLIGVEQIIVSAVSPSVGVGGRDRHPLLHALSIVAKMHCGQDAATREVSLD